MSLKQKKIKIDISHLKIKSTDNIFICGTNDYGKSTFANAVIDELKKNKTHAIIITDIQNEYEGDFEIYSYDDWQKYLNDDDHFKIGKIYVLKFSQDVADYERAISDIHTNEFSYIYFVFDEASLFTSPSYIHRDLQNFAAFHKHRACGFTVITRRPAEISRFLTMPCTRLFSFCVDEPIDVEYLKKRGFDPDEILNLPKYKYVERQKRRNDKVST